MKIKLILSLLILSSLVQMKCKSKKDSTTNQNSPPEVAANNENHSTVSPSEQPITEEQQAPPKSIKPEETQSEAQNEKYRLHVSFYSKGEGIDRTSVREDLLKFADNYTPKVTYEEIRWGREGEIDYCFKLNELTPEQQKEFVSKSRKILASSQLVYINENVPCVNKRR